MALSLENIDTHKLYTPFETSSLVGLKNGSLSNMRARNTGPHFVRVGSRIFYHGEDLIRYLIGNRIETIGGQK